MLVSVPDITSDIRTSLNQSGKWKTTDEFQSPMLPCINGTDHDLWIGEVIHMFFFGKTEISQLQSFKLTNSPLMDLLLH